MGRRIFGSGGALKRQYARHCQQTLPLSVTHGASSAPGVVMGIRALIDALDYFAPGHPIRPWLSRDLVNDLGFQRCRAAVQRACQRHRGADL
jgi:hypothetical protein